MAIREVAERATDEVAVSERVVSAVATTSGTDPMDLEPLYDAIDPDSLDALYERDGHGRAGSPERVEFTYSGCEIAVTGDGSVTVSEVAPGEP